MGIRINVVMGWGLKKTKGLDDPRFTDNFRKLYEEETNLVEPLQDACNDILKTKTSEEEWIDRSRATDLLRCLDDMKELYIGDIFHCSGLVGSYVKFAPMVFVPLRYTEKWFRHDDSIDYHISRGAKDSVRLVVGDGGFPCTIFPYCGYMNKKTGKAFRGPNVHAYTSMRVWAKQKKIEKLEELFTPEAIANLHDEYGIDSMDSLFNDVVPKVPDDLKILFDTLKIFKDPSTMNDLLPMVYTYWE